MKQNEQTDFRLTVSESGLELDELLGLPSTTRMATSVAAYASELLSAEWRPIDRDDPPHIRQRLANAVKDQIVELLREATQICETANVCAAGCRVLYETDLLAALAGSPPDTPPPKQDDGAPF